jgi:hypothetical protein
MIGLRRQLQLAHAERDVAARTRLSLVSSNLHLRLTNLGHAHI